MMAASNMACAASGILLPSSLASASSSSYKNCVAFHVKNGDGRFKRLVVCAAEEAAPSPAAATNTTVPQAEGEAKAAKPPPIGPKRGTKVPILYIKPVTLSLVLYKFVYFLIGKRLLIVLVDFFFGILK